ncbi:PP2C family protein-serine/threonine phosphatase [Streptosporangium sp. NPDC004379]|uniref:PP2C family protein-serine/threonine phosphatase n=1 Tax=Streptosporangium sp. NPDC004379 TaxID=3366189 RepID=UPI0036A0D57B
MTAARSAGRGAGAAGGEASAGLYGDAHGDARGGLRTGVCGDPPGGFHDVAARAPDEALLRAVVDACGEGVVLCDAAGTVVARNAAAARLLPAVLPGTEAASTEAGLFDAGCPEGEGREAVHGGRRLLVRRESFGMGHRAWYLRDVTVERDRTEALLAERRRTGFLLEAGRRLASSLNPRRCARAAVELASPFLADVAMVVLPPAARRQAPWLRSVPGRPVLQEGVIGAAEVAQVPGLTEALAGFPPVPSRWLDPAQVPQWLLPEGFGAAAHLLVTPLPGNGVPAGALILARGAGGEPFDEETETLVRVFASRAGAAISAAALYQEQGATNAILTGGLLPPHLPQPPGAELAGSLRAALQTSLVGGDFYDVCPPEDAAPGGEPAGTARGEALLMLGDVCGKGPRAAVLAGQVRQSLRALALLERRPGPLVELLNRCLLASPVPNSFVTLVLGSLAADGGGGVRLELAVAGHPPPLVLRADGTVTEVVSRGSMLGAMRRILLEPVTVQLAPGEVCLLYSDGITEAFGGPSGREMYGGQRLKAALAGCAGMPASAVVERLEQLSTEWLAGRVQDDRALLAVRAEGPR